MKNLPLADDSKIIFNTLILDVLFLKIRHAHTSGGSSTHHLGKATPRDGGTRKNMGRLAIKWLLCLWMYLDSAL